MTSKQTEPCEICHRTDPAVLNKCSECDKSFHNSACLAKHFLQQHLFRTLEPPDDCSEDGGGRSRLVPAANGSYVREFSAGVSCPTCDKVFASASAMERHRVRAHERAFPCALCGTSFRFACQLREHVRSHTGEKPFACHLCTRSYATRRHLKRHLALHAESRLHVCLECERGFTCEESLVSHSLEHMKPVAGS